MSHADATTDPAALESFLAHRLTGLLQLRLELDPRMPLRLEAPLVEAMGELVALAKASAPLQSELYLALAPPAERLVPVGACHLTARWQVTGDRLTPSGVTGGEAMPLRPGVRGARSVAESPAACALRRAFEAAGWTLRLEPAAGDEELWGWARPVRGGP